MNYTRNPHQIVYHYADGVADILGLSTAQQLAIRTAMHLALREQAAGYEATQAELTSKIHALTTELAETWRGEAEESNAIATLLATVTTSEAPATISTNGTHPRVSSDWTPGEAYLAEQAAVSFVTEAAQESAAEPDPTPAPSAAAAERKPHRFTWQTLDDQTMQIVQALDACRQDWRSLQREDKRIIVTAAITELQLDMPPGQTLGLLEFDRRRPIWMSG